MTYSSSRPPASETPVGDPHERTADGLLYRDPHDAVTTLLLTAARLFVAANGDQAPADLCGGMDNSFVILAERALATAQREAYPRLSEEEWYETAEAPIIDKWWYEHGAATRQHRHFVYEFWKGSECLYVGQTSHLKNRLRRHRTRFGPLADKIKVSPYASYAEAVAEEAVAIRTLQPTFNLLGK